MFMCCFVILLCFQILLPEGWKKSLPMEQHEWVSKALFSKAGILKNQLQLWWFPPGPPHTLLQPPASPAPFHLRPFVLWMPYRMWSFKLCCPVLRQEGDCCNGWSTQRRHVKCIQDPPGITLYTQTGQQVKGGVVLPVYRCARGSTSLESFHLHRFIPGKCCYVEQMSFLMKLLVSHKRVVLILQAVLPCLQSQAYRCRDVQKRQEGPGQRRLVLHGHRVHGVSSLWQEVGIVVT